MDDALLRVSDADRCRAVIALREHLPVGRLTLEEFSERVDARPRPIGIFLRRQNRSRYVVISP